MKNLDHKIEEMEYIKLIQLEDKVNRLLYDYHEMKQKLDDISDERHNKIKFPHRCPICNGEGSITIEDDYCIPCDGRGIVWG